MAEPLGLSFEEGRAPSVPRDAATVLVLREREGELEVYCVVRDPRSGFLGGALVFPGGKVDAADAPGCFARVTGSAHPRLAELADSAEAARALLVAAARETLEEAGVLAADAARALVASMTSEVRRGTRFAEVLRGAGLHVELERLWPFARWITPEAEARRFDARFFLLALPRDQEPSPDPHETPRGAFFRPRAALDAFAAGEVQLAPPTTRCLELLATVRTIDEARSLAERQSLLPICPRFVPGDPPALALPGDPAHEVAEPRVSGATRFILRDGRFVSDDA
jgi:8-oxo-dGTP pyrophosphatase MutT (NUDIX family)